MIPIMSHGFTVGSLIAEHIQVGVSVAIGMMFMSGSILSPIISIIATKIIETNHEGAFYLYLGMTILASVFCVFIKVPK